VLIAVLQMILGNVVHSKGIVLVTTTSYGEGLGWHIKGVQEK
jgi:hypothetical protein